MAALSVLPIVGLAFAVWAVYLGGLAALQNDCDASIPNGSHLAGVMGISNDLPCSKVYRWYWFLLAWQLVVLTGLLITAVSGRLYQWRSSFVGLLAISTVLYMYAANTFLSGQSVDYFAHGQPLHRIRTATAGAIMVALMSAIGVVVVGSSQASDRHPTAGPAANKAHVPGTGADTGVAAV